MFNGLKNNKINVGFLDSFSPEWIGGINYLKNLFISLSCLDNAEITPILFPRNQASFEILSPYCKIQEKSVFKNAFLKKLIGLNNHIKRVIQIDTPINFILNAYFKHKNLRVFSHSKYFTQDKYFKTLMWIPDFQFIHLPEMYPHRKIDAIIKLNEYYAKNADLVVLSSQDALKDFKSLYPQYSDKARILHFIAHPEPDIYKKEFDINYNKSLIEKYNIPEKFFFIANQVWKHKNHEVVLKAVNLLKQKNIDVKVLCSGSLQDYRGNEHINRLKNYIIENNLQDRVYFLGTINHREVMFFMRNCVSLINPSFFEGWNTGVEEAKTIGKSLILSNLNVHIEQNPPIVDYFDPKNHEELANILQSKWEGSGGGPDYELEKKARQSLSQRIKEYAQTYAKYIFEVMSAE